MLTIINPSYFAHPTVVANISAYMNHRLLAGDNCLYFDLEDLQGIFWICTLYSVL